jgi:small-conductance mechanosensitive channel/CRP-like cAMP-binding protein
MHLIRKLSPPLLAVVVTGVLFHFVEDDYRAVGLAAFESFREVAKYVLGIAIFLSVATLGERLIRLIVLDGIVASALGAPVPRVLSQLSSMVVYGTACLAIAGIIFKQDLTVLWAASGVAGIVLGMALQPMLTDVFAGLAMNFDAPFRLGDTVRLSLPDQPELEGQILEVSWRTARIVTSSGDIAIVPNNKLATAIVVNHCLPTNRSRVEIVLRVAAAVPPVRMLRVLNAAAREALWPDAETHPQVVATGVSEGCVEYSIAMPVPLAEHVDVRSRVLGQACTHMRHTGLLEALGTAAMAMKTGSEPSVPQIQALLAATFLFQDIGAAGLDRLTAEARLEVLPADRILCAAGETVSCAVLVLEGLLTTAGRRPSDPAVLLGPGRLIGAEAMVMSAAQPATVRCLTDALVLMIDRDAFGGLLRDSPALAPVLSVAIAGQLIRDDQSQGHVDEADLAADVLRQLRLSFGILRQQPAGRLAWTA